METLHKCFTVQTALAWGQPTVNEFVRQILIAMFWLKKNEFFWYYKDMTYAVVTMQQKLI